MLSGPPSKPLVGILGDVDGRIVPVAPPPVFEYEPIILPGCPACHALSFTGK